MSPRIRALTAGSAPLPFSIRVFFPSLAGYASIGTPCRASTPVITAFSFTVSGVLSGLGPVWTR
jgi:hypothetical protein